MTQWAVRVDDVSKKFRLYHERNQSLKSAILRGKTSQHEDFWALKNVSFDVQEGATHALVGSNGSGKSTLLKCLAKIYWPNSGTIEYRGRMASLLEVGSGFHLELSGRENIYLNGSILGMSKNKKETILQDILFKVHLNYKDRFKYPHQFSGGQRQRIAIARSLAVNPRIIILDEPVSSLDVIIQSEILKLLKALQKELSLTYIFISHDLRVVEYMADEVAVMHEGKIVEFGSSESIYLSPKEPYTKKLLKSILTL